jgi:hypothetical protein
MNGAISQEKLAKETFDVLEEIFSEHHGIFLDKGTGLFETLEGISAGQASQPVGGRCATLAAQVAHVILYLEVLERYLLSGDARDVDWGEVWRTVHEVTPDEWDALRSKLRLCYTRVDGVLHGVQDWNDEVVLSGCLAVIAHTAYHLGEIRQALCILR